jgi:3-phenylpropionate/trans-cinnamate dioxygenase ferredoxin reductase subunit
MRDAVNWLRERGVSVTLTASDGDGTEIRKERPDDLLGEINAEDVVYVAGAPSQVEAVRQKVLEADGTFYADPFYVADTRMGLRDWAAVALGRQMSMEPAAVNA